MLDMKIFGDKLRGHRKNLGMSQDDVAEKIGVSAQAVSKWEKGECLPDCFNLKLLSEVYGISVDILLETEAPSDIDRVAARIEQLADEYIWTKSSCSRSQGGYSSHRDLGFDLLKLWKGIYFIEAGDHERQKQDKEAGNLRIISDFGFKVWDDEGVVAVVNRQLTDKLDRVSEQDFEVMHTLCSGEGIKLISAFSHSGYPISKDKLVQQCGLELARINAMLLMFMEAGIVEYVTGRDHYPSNGYKICGHFGIAAYLAIAALFLLSKKNYTLSEYIPNREE